MRLLRAPFKSPEQQPYPWALRFESGDYVNLGNVLNGITQDTPFALECMIRTTATGSQAFICSQMSGPTGKGVQLGQYGNNRTLIARIQGENRLERGSSIRINTGQWTHVGMRYGGGKTPAATLAGIRVVVNGVFDDDGVTTDEGPPGDMTTTQPTYLGVRAGSQIPFVGDMDEVRVWIGTVPLQAHFSHYAGRRIPTPYPILFANHAKKFDASAHQGVGTDGTYIYPTDNGNVYKHDMEGEVVGTFQHGIAGFKNEDPCVVDGVLYVPLTNHPSTPRMGKVQKIDPSDMSLIGTIDLDEAIWPASVAYRDGEFWMSVTESDTIYVYNENFELLRTYTFPVFGQQRTDYPGYSGLEWIGDFLYGNKHEGQQTHALDVCRYDPVTDTLIPVGAFSHVSSGTTQGMAYDPLNEKVYWAARGHNREVWESDLSGGLRGYWRLEEGQGSSVADETGNHADGTISGATWVYRRT